MSKIAIANWVDRLENYDLQVEKDRKGRSYVSEGTHLTTNKNIGDSK